MRQDYQSTLDVYLLFKPMTQMTFSQIRKLVIGYSDGTLLNLLRELRQFGLIKYEKEKYSLRNSREVNSEELFQAYARKKLLNNTIYMEIMKDKSKEYSLSMIGDIIKDKIKITSYSDKTLETYARKIINWFKFADLPLANLELALRKEVENITTFTPQNNPRNVIDYFLSVKNNQKVNMDLKTSKLLYDLKSIGLLTYISGKVLLTNQGATIKKEKNRKIQYNKIANLALKKEKIRKAYEIIKNQPNIKTEKFQFAAEDILIGINSEAYLKRSVGILKQWGKFVFENCA